MKTASVVYYLNYNKRIKKIFSTQSIEFGFSRYINKSSTYIVQYSSPSIIRTPELSVVTRGVRIIEGPLY